MNSKIAIMLSRFPYPLDKGDKLRAFHQIKYLSTYFDIHLFCLTDKIIPQNQLQELETYCQRVTLYKQTLLDKLVFSIWSILKNYPFQVGLFYSNRIKKQFSNAIHSLCPDLIYTQLSRTILFAKDEDYPLVVDFQDSFSTNYHRIQSQSSGIKRWFYQRESKLMKKFESQMLEWTDASAVISHFDKSEISNSANNLVVVSNGVDTNYFQPLKSNDKKYDILFTGNLAYEPNKQAALFLIQKIMPALHNKNPMLKLYLAGAEPGTLSQYNSSQIIVSGWLPDIREAYNESSIFVAPLLSGAGLQNKLLEAMSMGLPCVSTQIANASLKAKVEEEILIANSIDEFVTQIERLQEDKQLYANLSIQGRDFVLKNYQWDASNHTLKKLFVKTIEHYVKKI
jgi:glycosyltransferase involved in cell wall biosynthesis